LKINQFFIAFGFAVNYGQAVRKYSNEFMNIGVDAAALGMANAVTASTSDVNWDTGTLLTHLEDHQLSLMHANYFANIAQYDIGCPIDDRSAWGVFQSVLGWMIF
jgi:endonuclease IV